MKMDLTPLQRIAIGLALVLTPAAAQADVIPAGSHVISFGDDVSNVTPLGAPLIGGYPLPAGTATFGKFNSPGTLNSATWTVKGLNMGFDFAHNVSATVAVPLISTPFILGVTGTAGVILALSLPGVNVASSTFSVSDPPPNVETCQGVAFPTPNPDFPLFPFPFERVECVLETGANTVIDTSFTVTGSDLDLFKGTGDVTAQSSPVAAWGTVVAFTPLTVPDLFPFSFVSGLFGGEGTLELTYDFTPGQSAVPIPATPLLLGVGLLGLALARRRLARS